MKTWLAILGTCLLGGVLPPSPASASALKELKDDFQEGVKSEEWRIRSNGCEVGASGGALRINGTVLESGWGKENGVVTKRALRNCGFEVSASFMVPKFSGKGDRLVYLQAMGASAMAVGLFYHPQIGYRLQEFKSSTLIGAVKPFGDEHRAFHRLKLVCDQQKHETRGYVDGILVGTLPVVLTGNIRFGLFASTQSSGMKIDVLFDDFHAAAIDLDEELVARSTSPLLARRDAPVGEPEKFSLAIQSKTKNEGKLPGFDENGRTRSYYHESTKSMVRAQRLSPQGGSNDPWLKVVCVGRKAITGELTVLHERAMKAEDRVLEYETPALWTLKRIKGDFVIPDFRWANLFRPGGLPSFWLGCVVLVYDDAGRVASHAEDSEGLYAALLEQFGSLDRDRNLESLERERLPQANIQWNRLVRDLFTSASYANLLPASYPDGVLVFARSKAISDYGYPLARKIEVISHPKVFSGDFVVAADVMPYGNASAMLLHSDLSPGECSLKLEPGIRRNLLVARRGRRIQFFLDGVEVPHEKSGDGFDPGGKLQWGLAGSLACRLHSLAIKETRPGAGTFRRWSLSGEQIEAELLDVSSGQVGLRRKDGREAAVPARLLSQKDLDYIDTQKLLAAFIQAEMRTWTAPNGKTIDARLVSVSGDAVVLCGADGRPVAVPVKNLSREDQRYLKSAGYAFK